MRDITPLNIQHQISYYMKYGNARTSSALSPNSVNGIITVIQSSMKTAYLLGYLDEYVADRIKRPHMTEKKVDCFTLKEQTKIENYCLNSNRKKLIGIILCLYTGVRVGELLALEWSDVDFANKFIHISKTCYNSPQGRIVGSPKTKSSHRIIPIPKQLIPLLKTLKRQTESGYVIESADGQPVGIRSYQRSFELMLKRLNIPHHGIHALRHTFATRAIECGMDVKTLSEILGHKNAQITLNRYSHSLIEHKIEMMNKLGTQLSSFKAVK